MIYAAQQEIITTAKVYSKYVVFLPILFGRNTRKIQIIIHWDILHAVLEERMDWDSLFPSWGCCG